MLEEAPIKAGIHFLKCSPITLQADQLVGPLLLLRPPEDG